MLTDKQKWAMKRSNARLNIWHGSVRSGKTYNCVARFNAAICEDKKNAPAGAIDAIIGKTLGALKRNVIAPTIELLGSKNAKYYPGKQEFNILGNTVHLFSGNDSSSIGKIQGSTIRKCLGDELTLWPQEFFKMMDTRLSTDTSQFFGSTNPDSPNHYIKTEYLDRQKELDLKTFHFELDDNDTLPKSYRDAMKLNFSGLWYDRYILGLWAIAEGVIYDSFSEFNIIDINPPASGYILSCDYGTNNPFAGLLMGYNRFTKPMLWAEHEYYYDSRAIINGVQNKQKTDAEYADELEYFCKYHLGNNWKLLLKKTIIDPSALSFKVELKKRLFPNVVDAENDVLDGIRSKAMVLKNGSYAINRKCPLYINSFKSYLWDKKQQLLGIDGPLKIDDHLQDAGRYGVYTTLFMNKSPSTDVSIPKVPKLSDFSKNF